MLATAMCASGMVVARAPSLLGAVLMARRRWRDQGLETPIPVPPAVLEGVLRSLEEDLRFEAEVSRTRMQLGVDSVRLRLR